MGFKLWGLFLCLFLLWGRSNIIQFSCKSSHFCCVGNYSRINKSINRTTGDGDREKTSVSGHVLDTEITGPADGLNLWWVSGKNKRSIQYYI